MANIVIDPVPEDSIDIAIPHGSKTVEVSVPPIDCLKPSEVAKAISTAQEVGVEDGTAEFFRHLLHVFARNKDQRAAVENMTTRQLVSLGNQWNELTEISLGEQSRSGDS